jgi:hypothetical protein
MARQINDNIVVARSNGWQNGMHREQPIDGRCPHCKVQLDGHRDECSFSDHTHGSCWQDDSLKPSQRMQSWLQNQDAARHMQDSHTCPLECRQCSAYLQSIEGFFSHLRDLHDWDLYQTFQGACASSPRTANTDIAVTGTLRTSHKSTALDAAIATHHEPGDIVQRSSPCGVRAASSDTSAEFPSSQAQKSPKPQDRSPSISEPEETRPPKKRVKLVYKHKLVCNFLA